jgi:hypothetical protein
MIIQLLFKPFRTRHSRAWLMPFMLLCLVLINSAAQAQFFAITHDRNNQLSQLAAVNSVDASITPVGAGVSALALNYNAVANNPFTQTIYALSLDPVAADGSSQLVAVDLITGTIQIIGNLGSTERPVSLHFERSSQRLIAALANGSALRLVSIDTNTAATTEIHTGMVGCCILSPSVSALSNGTLWFSGRLSSDPATTTRLIGFSTSGDNAFSNPVLSGSLAVLVEDPSNTTLYGLRQTTTGPPFSTMLDLVQVASDGSLTPVGMTLNDCCAIALDTAAVSNSQLLVVARMPNDPGRYLLSVNLNDGSSSFSSSALADTLHLNALFDELKGLIPTTTQITSVTPDPVMIGNSYSVAVNVSSGGGAPTGTITVDDGLGQQCMIVAPNGQCSLPSTAQGMPTLTASYAATGNFTGSSDTTTVTIGPTNSSTQISAIVPSPSVVGTVYTVNVVVSGFNPTGTVMVADGLGMSCMIVLPASSCDLNSANAGNRVITAQYSGDFNNIPSADTAPHDVNPAASVTSIDLIAPSPSVVGTPYSVTVSVAGFGMPTGTITVSDGDGAQCQIILPANSCDLTSTIAGPKTISAAYPGDINNQASMATAPHTVEAAVSTTQIVSTAPNPSVAGQPYSVTVQVTGFGTPTGSVTVDDGQGQQCVVTLPDNSCDLVSLNSGNITVSANYSGDNNNLPSSDNTNHTVDPAPTSLALFASPNPVPIGADVLLTAVISDGVEPLTGTVDFTLNGASIAGCSGVAVVNAEAQCITQFDQPLALLIGATYAGDGNNLMSSTELAVIVQPLAIPVFSPFGLLLLLTAFIGLACFHLRRRPSQSH